MRNEPVKNSTVIILDSRSQTGISGSDIWMIFHHHSNEDGFIPFIQIGTVSGRRNWKMLSEWAAPGVANLASLSKLYKMVTRCTPCYEKCRFGAQLSQRRSSAEPTTKYQVCRVPSRFKISSLSCTWSGLMRSED